MMKETRCDALTVKVYDSRRDMGEAAAREIKACILALLEGKEELNAIFAAAPSQNEVLAALAADGEIPWERINAYHMDEYVGLPAHAPQGFGNFLRAHLFDLVPFKTVNLMDPTAPDPEAECARYARLLEEHPADLVVLGIGENGHVAFNDPPVADFNDPKTVKTVALDPVCRQQQVNDGCFATLAAVPTHALTVTVPALVAAPHLFCIVPAPTKAWAVRQTLTGEVRQACPASILRRRRGAILYLDPDSAALWEASL